MSNNNKKERKEKLNRIIRMSFGISEYPWSSDEDNEASHTTVVSSSAPRAGPSEIPGTSDQTAPMSSTSNSPSSRRIRTMIEPIPDSMFTSTMCPRTSSNTETSRSSRNNLASFMLCGTSSRGVNSIPAALARNSALVAACASRACNTLKRATSGASGSPHAWKRNSHHILRHTARERNPTMSRISGIPLPVCKDAVSVIRSSRLNGPTITTNLLDSTNNALPSNALFPGASASRGAWRAHPSSPQLDNVARSDDEVSVVIAEDSSTSNGNNAEQENVEDIGGTTTAALEVSLEEILEIDPEPEVNNADVESNVDINVVDIVTPTKSENPVNELTSHAPEDSQRRGSKRKLDANDDDSAKELNQKLLRLLECPVCLEWLEPPMAQCRRGHLVCVACRARLAACPVCRTAFSSVRNRAMEGVAEIVRYPCRHGCGCLVRLRRRSTHEASCTARRYRCIAPICDVPPAPLDQLIAHVEAKHMEIVKVGNRHKFSMLMNNERHEDWLVLAMRQLFHLRINVDVRSWSFVVYVTYIGPKCNAYKYTYEVTIAGQYRSRNLVYSRVTHSDLENSSLNISRQDCFHLTMDQVHNFLRFKNKHCETDKMLEFEVVIHKLQDNDDIPLEVV